MFKELKTRLTTTPVLTLLDSYDGFVVYDNASRVGLGCFLMLRGKFLAYTSRHLKPHENKYPTHDLEFEVVVLVLMIWRYYFYGVHVDLFIDDKIFQYMFSLMVLNLYQGR